MRFAVGHLCFAKTGDVHEGTTLLRKTQESRLDAAWRLIGLDR